MYVGDSITDLQALELVKAGGGLAVSFNGNAYAIQGAQVACLGRDTGIISIIAQLFAEKGTEGVITLLSRWGEKQLRSAGIDKELLAHLQGSEAGEITPDNQSRWSEKSQQFRTQVRGVSIGSLG
jgi:energy-converting hydrogenase A subunit R